MKKYLSLVILFLTACNLFATDHHFLNDPSYRKAVNSSFTERMKMFSPSCFQVKGLKATETETEALQFLYAYMPLADLTDYSTSFFLANVRKSLQAQSEMAWGAKVPEREFRHFVLPIRINNENLDSFRIVYYEELKNRVKGLGMKEAILEVNHWCHEHVTYQPADARTSAPMATIRTTTGRCGEESTFTVAALRAVGIPARQVYTPRWAHTDDNHAWVEAWADGQWYFIGACEPEAVLNLGWFNAPASRALLMHTRAFGNYDGPEEVVLRTSNYTEINLIDNYAKSARVDFKVVDQNNNPVTDARVDFKIYNYAEFYTAVTKYTDSKGETYLSAGLGDMLVWASKDGKYGYQKATFGKDKEVTICIKSDGDAARSEDLDLVPPPEKLNQPEVTPEQASHNKMRFAQEDSIRNAYIARTFYPKDGTSPYASYFLKAKGNWRTIEAFLSRHKDQSSRALAILNTLSDKDLRDIRPEILEDCFANNSAQVSPHVEDEMLLAPFKCNIEKMFDAKTVKKFQNNPMLLAEWIKKNIRLNPDTKALRIAQTPMGSLTYKMTDPRSRAILFVDMARSLNIEAKRDTITGSLEYRKDGKWTIVDFDAKGQATSHKGKLVLTYEPTKQLDNPLYYNHFSISKLENGVTELLNFEEQSENNEPTSWRNTFKEGFALEAGTYLLTSGTRLANGSVLAHNERFEVKEGQTTTLPLVMRQNTHEISVIGSFNAESLFSLDGKSVSLLSQTGRGYYIIGLIGVGQEPSNHALRDIAKEAEAFNAWGRPLVLLFESEAEAKKYEAATFGNLPTNIIYGIDKDGSIRKQIVENMKLSSATQLPIFLIADTFNRVVFSSQGYTIGLGEQMKNIINKLQ